MSIFSNLFSKKQTETRDSSEGGGGFSYYNQGLFTYNPPSNWKASNLSAVYAATELISSTLASIKTQVHICCDFHKDKLLNHPLNLVFQSRNNSIHTYFTLMKNMIRDVLLQGNGYAYIKRAKDGTVLELIYLKPGEVVIDFNETTNNLTYVVSKLNLGRISPKDIIHLKKNSFDSINGVSVISFAKRTIEIASSSEEASKEFFNSGGLLSGVLSYQGNLSAKQKEDLRESWNSAYGQGQKGSKTAILSGGFTYTPLSINSEDLQLLESREFNVIEIARWFNLSPILLGDLSKGSYASIEAANLDFLRTLTPYIVMIEQEFNRKLLKDSELNLSIDLDEKSILRTDKQSMASYYSTLFRSGIMTINEIREELGLCKVDDEMCSKNIVPYTDISMNNISSDNKKEETKEDEEKITQ